VEGDIADVGFRGGVGSGQYLRLRRRVYDEFTFSLVTSYGVVKEYLYSRYVYYTVF
jgi:hypothetical protein